MSLFLGFLPRTLDNFSSNSLTGFFGPFFALVKQREVKDGEAVDFSNSKIDCKKCQV